MLRHALLSLVVPGSGEIVAGHWGKGLFAGLCALVAWSIGPVWVIGLSHLASAWVAGCVAAERVKG